MMVGRHVDTIVYFSVRKRMNVESDTYCISRREEQRQRGTAGE